MTNKDLVLQAVKWSGWNFQYVSVEVKEKIKELLRNN